MNGQEPCLGRCAQHFKWEAKCRRLLLFLWTSCHSSELMETSGPACFVKSRYCLDVVGFYRCDYNVNNTFGRWICSTDFLSIYIQNILFYKRKREAVRGTSKKTKIMVILERHYNLCTVATIISFWGWVSFLWQPQTCCFTRPVCQVPEALCAGRVCVGAACDSTERISLCVLCTAVLH